VTIQKKIQKRTKRRALHVRDRLRKDSTLPRVSVFRSLNQIYAQIIDDVAHKTLVSCSSVILKEDKKAKKSDVATSVGVELAKQALGKGIKKVCFDRGSYLYHGRVKALADGLRTGGLEV
jgi:large subunit ribosomal protein L18